MKFQSSAVPGLLTLLVLLGAVAAPTHAQERETRRQFLGALVKLEEEAQNNASWIAWRDDGGLLQLTREVDAGKLANPEAIRSNVAKLAQSLGSNFDSMRGVNEALSIWLGNLELATPPDQASIVAATNHEVETGAASRALFQKELQGQLERLDRSLKATADSGARWYNFLLWESTTRLVAQESLTDDALDALETRWSLAQSHWNTLRFRHTAQSLLRAIVLARRSATSDLSTVVERATRQLPEASGDMNAAATAALQTLDRLDLGAAFSVPVHRSYAFPHCELSIRADALLPKFREEIDETFRINDRFAGTAVRGTGRIRGSMSIEPLVRVVPAWNVVFKGSSTSSTVGSNSGVTVNSSANAAIRGTKAIEWRDTGLVPLPASATAEASVSFDGISTGGSRGRRSSTARSEVYASRAAAERDTELAIRRSCIERLDTHTRRLLQPLNERYEESFTRPINGQETFAPRVVTHNVDSSAVWRCWYTPVEGIALAKRPDERGDSDWSLALHELFLARHLTAMFGQRDVRLSELGSLLGAMASDKAEDTSPSPVVRLRAIEPIEVHFDQQAVQVKLHLDEFRSAQGNVTVPTTIELAYQCSLDAGRIQLARTASPIVRLQADPATGRSQTLKRILIRHLSRALPEKTTLSITALRGNEQPASFDTTITAFSLSSGWLQTSGAFAKS